MKGFAASMDMVIGMMVLSVALYATLASYTSSQGAVLSGYARLGYKIGADVQVQKAVYIAGESGIGAPNMTGLLNSSLPEGYSIREVDFAAGPGGMPGNGTLLDRLIVAGGRIYDLRVN